MHDPSVLGDKPLVLTPDMSDASISRRIESQRGFALDTTYGPVEREDFLFHITHDRCFLPRAVGTVKGDDARKGVNLDLYFEGALRLDLLRICGPRARAERKPGASVPTLSNWVLNFLVHSISIRQAWVADWSRNVPKGWMNWSGTHHA